MNNMFISSAKKDEAVYRYGKLVTEMYDNALDVEIKKISACGGWSRMDYTIIWEQFKASRKK